MAKQNDEDGLKGLAIAGVICGIIAWFTFAIVIAPMGIVFSILALRSNDNSTKTWATTGLVVNTIELVLMMFSLSLIAHLR